MPREGGSYFFFAGFEAFFCDSALPAAEASPLPILAPSGRIRKPTANTAAASDHCAMRR